MLRLNVTYQNSSTGTKSDTQTLGESTDQTLRRSDASSTQTSVEASASITAGVEATAGLPPGVTVSASDWLPDRQRPSRGSERQRDS